MLLAASSGDPRHEGGAGPGAPEPPWPAALRTSFRSLQASVQLGARYPPPGATAGAPPAEAPLVSWPRTLALPIARTLTLTIARTVARTRAEP